MDEEKEKIVKGFYHMKECYYWKSAEAYREKFVIDEIMIGLYSTVGGTDGEFAIKWYSLLDKIHPRLMIFGESFNLINEECRDFVEALKDHKDITPQDCVLLLQQLGYEDLTKRVDPDDLNEGDDMD